MKNLTFCKICFISTITLILVTLNAMSQEISPKDIKWIENLKVPNVEDIDVMKMDAEVLIYQSKDLRNHDLYSSYTGIHKNSIYRVDLKAKQTIEKEIILRNGDKRRTVEKVLYINNIIHVFSSFINQEQKKYYIFDETLNSNNLELNNDTKKVCEIDYSQFDGSRTYTITTSISFSNGKILLTSSIYTKEGWQYFVNIYDTQMNEKVHYTFKNSNKDAYISYIINDFEDNLYVIETTETKKVKQYKNIIYYYPKCQTAPKQLPLIMGDNVREINVSVNVNKKNELICAGLFSRLGRKSAIGAYTVVFPAGLDGAGELNTLSFTNEFLTRGFNERETSEVANKLKRDEEFNDNCTYIVDTLHIHESGDFSFITEKTKTSWLKDNCYFTFGDLYTFSCNSDGSFKWSQKITKDLVFKNVQVMAGSHMTYYDSNNNMNLIYCSFIPVKILGQKLGIGKDPKTVITTFDSSGNKTEKVLFTEKDLVQNFIPTYSKSTGNNNLIITRINTGFMALGSTYSVAQVTIK